MRAFSSTAVRSEALLGAREPGCRIRRSPLARSMHERELGTCEVVGRSSFCGFEPPSPWDCVDSEGFGARDPRIPSVFLVQGRPLPRPVEFQTAIDSSQAGAIAPKARASLRHDRANGRSMGRWNTTRRTDSTTRAPTLTNMSLERATCALPKSVPRSCQRIS